MRHRLRLIAILSVVLTSTTAGIEGQRGSQPFSTVSDAVTRKAIADAVVLAKSTHRFVLLNFGADWCPECRILTKTFAEPAVARFLKANFVPVKIDVGQMVGINYTEKNIDLTLKYGAFTTKESIAVPFIVILDGNGSVVSRTNNGEWKHAPAVTPENVLRDLQRWAPKR